MEIKKYEIVKQIIEVLAKSSKPVNPSVITQTLNWNKDFIKEVCDLFNVQKFSEILKQISEIEINQNEHGTSYVRLVHEESNAKSEEKKMAENETKTENLHDRIQKIRDALSEGLIEKEEIVRLLLLTAIAGESSFLLGAPGCAKSMLARRMALAFKADGENGVKYFETLLNQYSTPEDVFGNISLKALNGELEGLNGKEEYRRLTENMLPEADIAFLDEIWKASPAILNTLLTIINERKFHNGSKVEDVPLKALFAASNELPAKDKGLEALYDRLILRLCVSYIQDNDHFFDMIESPSSDDFELSDEVKALQITKEELKDWKKKIDKVSLSAEAKDVIIAIRKELARRNSNMSDEDKQKGELFEVSDRRWKKIAHILKTSAFLNDRSKVDLMDCQLIEYCIWSTEKQQKQVRDIVKMCIEENGLDCDSAVDEINKQIAEFKACVEDEWLDKIEEAATDKIVVVDGEKCYECTNQDDNNKTYYITVERIDTWNNSHRIYDSNKNYVRDYSFAKTGNRISCYENFTIKKNLGKTHFVLKNFSDIAHETRQKNFDKEHYAPIVDRINKQIEELKAQKEKDAIPFKANLFANQEYNESITAKLDGAINDLQDANVSLDKERNRYFKTELVAALSVGDVILKNGTVYMADEIPYLTDDEKANVIAVVCLAGEKTYAMGLEQYKDKWDNIATIAADYGKKNNIPSEFSQNWIVPNKDLLNAIFANKDLINESLEAIGEEIEVLSEEKYWSSTENGDSAAFFQNFDENGEQDNTTKPHEYAVFVVREWKKS